MAQHKFILEHGSWLGEGTITFSESPESLKFYTRWEIANLKGGEIEATQHIEVQGVPEKMVNSFHFSDVTDTTFLVQLDNQLLGSVGGKGLVDSKVVAWEFHTDAEQGIEGYEVYELQEDGTYTMRAEYVSADQFRTIIEGKLWQAASL